MKNDWTFDNSNLMPHTMGKRPMMEIAKFPVDFNIRITFRTEREALMNLLPPGLQPDGEPTISFIHRHSENVSWVLGGEFNSIGVGTNVVGKDRSGDPVKGTYVPVVWETDAMAVILGREVFGVPKLYGDISNPFEIDGIYRTMLSDRGYPLIELRIGNLVEITGRKLSAMRNAGKDRAIIGWKQFPTPNMNSTQLGYRTLYPAKAKINQAWQAKGEVIFHQTEPNVHVWTHSCLQTLQALPRYECLGATLSRGSSELQLCNSQIF